MFHFSFLLLTTNTALYSILVRPQGKEHSSKFCGSVQIFLTKNYFHWQKISTYNIVEAHDFCMFV